LEGLGRGRRPFVGSSCLLQGGAEDTPEASLREAVIDELGSAAGIDYLYPQPAGTSGLCGT
jgi:hypothetical protein